MYHHSMSLDKENQILNIWLKNNTVCFKGVEVLSYMLPKISHIATWQASLGYKISRAVPQREAKIFSATLAETAPW